MLWNRHAVHRLHVEQHASRSYASGNRYPGAKAMRRLFFVLLLWSCGAMAQTVKTAGAWLPVNVKWQHAPPEINPKLETGSATVLYFDQQGHFAIIGCVINREPGRYTTVSAGDGQVVSLGEWDSHLPGHV